MYSFGTQLETDYTSAVARVSEALRNEGFGVITEIDVKETLKKKLGVKRQPYLILGACNPELANKALAADPDIGVLLPCNVVVREDDDGRVSVLFMDPATVMGLVGNPGVKIIAEDVKARLMRVCEVLQS